MNFCRLNDVSSARINFKHPQRRGRTFNRLANLRNNANLENYSRRIHLALRLQIPLTTIFQAISPTGSTEFCRDFSQICSRRTIKSNIMSIHFCSGSVATNVSLPKICSMIISHITPEKNTPRTDAARDIVEDLNSYGNIFKSQLVLDYRKLFLPYFEFHTNITLQKASRSLNFAEQIPIGGANGVRGNAACAGDSFMGDLGKL